MFLEAPPADGLRAAQDHFKLYVKPILVASGLDWEFIQGRKEGDIRAELAERIRRERTPVDERLDVDEVEDARKRAGVVEYNGPRGDIVMGRHTWKEYVRGLHEGWLGPLTEPPKPVIEEPLKEESVPEPVLETLPGITIHSTASEELLPPATETSKEEEKPKNAPKPAPFISTADYTSASLPAELPTQFSPSTPIEFPHILGFLNTPRRLYRFLNRRVMADEIGRETAAIILGSARPYHTTSSISDISTSQSEDGSSTNAAQTEQESALSWEEKEWHKSIRKHVENEPERTWLEPIVLDERIASRMRRFEITTEEEEKSKGIFVPEIEVEGWIKGGLRSLGRSAIDAIGMGDKVKIKSGAEMGMEGDEDS